jgi:D-sedoheptulose 7-phosphate isomerase
MTIEQCQDHTIPRDLTSYPIAYQEKLWEVLNNIEVKDAHGELLPLEQAVIEIVDKMKTLKEKENKVIFIGNGGSAGIASHQAIDFWKNGEIPSINFNDASLLTCLSNDYGYEFVFEKPIKTFAKKGDILIAISSSGKSENILKAVLAAKEKDLFIITMSGFSKTNPLRALGDINFYVPSMVYGHVEIAHLILSHTILDTHMDTKL